MQTRTKGHEGSVVGFDQLDYIKFPSVNLSGTTQNNSVVAARLYLPTVVKIYRLIVGISGSVAGTISANVVAGTAAEIANSGGTIYTAMPIPDTDYAGQPIGPGAQAYPPAYASAGQRLLLNDGVVTITADTATVFTPSDSAATGAYAPNTPGNTWDALWGPGGAELTLRLPCTGATALVEAGILVKYYDPNYSKPQLTPFNPATDLP
jgi:hypothetical protein